MKLRHKYFYNLEKAFLLLFLVCLLIPKMDIIDIEGYWQGIRLEDFCLLIYVFIILLNYEEKIINNYSLQRFLPLFFYFFLILFACYISILSNISIKYLSLARIAEYIVLIILACNLKISKKEIIIYLKIYILINILVVLLQHYNLIGSFSSLGYLPANHQLNTRSFGLTGGSWELGVIVSLCYFIIVKLENPRNYIILVYFLIALYLNLLAESRVNFIAFFIANLIFLKNHLENKYYYFSILILILSALLSIISIKYLNFQLSDKSLDRLINTNYLQSFEILKNFFLFLELPVRDDLDVSVWSLWYRLSLWNKLLYPYLDNILTIIFGSGTYAIYFESSILRVVLTTGIIGVVYVMYTVRNLELYIIFYFLIAGITLDLFNSFKIFSFTILYYRFVYENNSYRRN